MQYETSRTEFWRRPFLWFGAAFAAGIALGSATSAPASVTIPLLLAAIAAAVVSSARNRPGLVVGAFLFAGATAAAFDVPAPDRIRALIDAGLITSDEPVTVRGRISADPENAVGGFFIELRSESLRAGRSKIPVSGSVRIFAPVTTDAVRDDYRRLALRYGDLVDITCRLDRDEPFRNPGTMNRVRRLDAEAIDATAALKSPFLIRRIEPGGGPMIIVYDLRRRLIDEFRRRFDQRTAGVMIASLLGNKEYLDRETAELFRDGGTFHVLVISGLHITFIGSLIVLALRRASLPRGVQAAVAIPLIWAYALAVGGDVPVTRAALMFTVLLIGRALYRDSDLLNLFGFCSFLILLRHPADLFSPSFQLTFASVGALIGIAFPLIEKLRAIGGWRPDARQPFPPSAHPLLVRFCERIYWSDRIWEIEGARNVWSARIRKSASAPRRSSRIARYLFEATAVSVIVQIAMLPLSVVYFNRVAFGAVILNLWVSALLAAETFAALGTVAVGAVSETAAIPLKWFAESLNSLLLALPRVFSELGVGSSRLPALTGPMSAVYVAFFAAIVLIAWRIYRWDPFELAPSKRRHPGRLAVVAALLAVAVATSPFAAPRPDGRLRVDFIDVGQGDSALVTFPDGTTMLIDGGGRPDFSAIQNDDGEPFEPDRATIGETVVSRFLWSRGLRRIDFLVATHADADHMQGLADIARNFDVGAAFIGRKAPGDPDFDSLIDALRRNRIVATQITRGQTLGIGTALVEFLHPDLSRPNANGNDDSVVVKIRLGDRSVLLTGDIEAAGERDLTAAADLGSDVVKVAHHGSRTSSLAEFIAKAKPSAAIISVGRDSPFGHPDQEVISRWRASGAAVLTTGDAGTITVSTDGSDLKIETFVR